MASRVTNRRAINSSSLVEPSNRQSLARTSLVETPKRSLKKRVNYKTIAGLPQAEDDIVDESDKESSVDLERNLITGQPSKDSLLPIDITCKSNINDNNIKKRDRSLEVADTPSIAATPEISQESEPVRLAKRRKPTQAVKDLHITASSPLQSANRRVGRFFWDASVQSPTFKEQCLRLSQREEIEDSYEAENSVGSSPFARILVEIPIFEDFDRDAYARVFVAPTPSTSTSQSESHQKLFPKQQDQSASQVFHSTIPDSQEFLTSSNTEYLESNIRRTLSDNRQATCITTSSITENKASGFEILSAPQISPTACTAQPDSSTPDNTVSDSTDVWQGAQIIPALDFVESQATSAALSFEIYQDTTKDQAAISLQEGSQDSSKHSVLSEKEANSLRTDSQTKGSSSPHFGTQEFSLRGEYPINQDIATRIIASEYSAQVELYISCQRSLSPSLHIPHSLDISSNLIPPRPRTPSNFEMAEAEPSSAGSKLSYAELAMQARDKVKARLVVPPSTAGPGPPSLSMPPNLSHQMLPVRENVGMPTSTAKEGNLDDDEPHNDYCTFTLHFPGLKPNDHAVFLPLASMVRDVYKATLQKNERDINSFLQKGDELDPRVEENVDIMIRDLKMLTDHQDLITDMTLTQSAVPDEHQTKWAETCSTKCLFLRHLLQRMRPYEHHIAILARPGRMLDILESILKVHTFIYERPDQPSRPNPGAIGPLRITLLPTGRSGGQYVVNRADAVIAFDETFHESERYSSVLRNHLYEPGRFSPLISLVVAYSAEHIELCLPKLEDPQARKEMLVDFIVQKHKEVGDLADGLPLPDVAAAAVAQYLQSGSSTWPFLTNADITNLDCYVRQQKMLQCAQLEDQQSLPVTTPHGTTKRALRAESICGTEIDSTKRMRMTPTPGDVASSGDITRVSDSVIHRSQVQLASMGDTAGEAIAKVDALDEAQSRQMSSLLERVDNLELELQNKNSTEEQLRQLVKSLEARLEDYESTMKKFQPKFQQAIADRRKFRVERDAAKSQAVALARTVETRVAEVARFREDKTNLETELGAARAALNTSTAPDTAKLAQTQEQVRTLQAEKDRLEKRIASMQKEVEYIREIYQKASFHTTELQNELSELKEENTMLKSKASENIIHVAEIQRANEAAEREERIDELEAELRVREQELRKKTQELQIKTNGRRETRGTSVPRSPRTGSGAMSPRPHFARPAGGSRGGSPAPGDPREGFRDSASFPSAALTSARWSHLT